MTKRLLVILVSGAAVSWAAGCGNPWGEPPPTGTAPVTSPPSLDGVPDATLLIGNWKMYVEPFSLSGKTVTHVDLTISDGHIERFVRGHVSTRRSLGSKTTTRTLVTISSRARSFRATEREANNAGDESRHGTLDVGGDRYKFELVDPAPDSQTYATLRLTVLAPSSGGKVERDPWGVSPLQLPPDFSGRYQRIFESADFSRPRES